MMLKIKLNKKIVNLLLFAIFVILGNDYCFSASEDKSSQGRLFPGEKIVSLKANDDVEIIGSFFYPSDYNSENKLKSNQRYPAVILLHMWKKDRYEWLPLIPFLQKANFAVLCIDFRKHGESYYNIDLDNDVLVPKMLYDARAAYDFMRNQDIVDQEKISLIGASLGAVIAVRLCAEVNKFPGNPPINSLVLISPAENYFGLQAITKINKCLATAALFVLNKQDRVVKGNSIYQSGLILFKYFKGKKEGLIFDSLGAHGTQMFLEEEFIPAILSWLNKHELPLKNQDQ